MATVPLTLDLIFVKQLLPPLGHLIKQAAYCVYSYVLEILQLIEIKRISLRLFRIASHMEYWNGENDDLIKKPVIYYLP